MRIAILTSGRFHACDLARELASRGHDVAFYSLVPPRRTRRFGLPAQCNRWLGPYVGPLYLLTRASLRSRYASRLLLLMSVLLDRVAARVVEPCDLFIGMSQMSLHTIGAVRRRSKLRRALTRLVFRMTMSRWRNHHVPAAVRAARVVVNAAFGRRQPGGTAALVSQSPNFSISNKDATRGERVCHGQQNDHRRLPPRGNPGRGSARQSRRGI